MPLTVPVGYGINPPGVSPFCDPQPESGLPICAPQIAQHLGQTSFFALARDLHYQTQCAAPRVGPGDIFEFQPARPVAQSNGSTCDLSMPHIETYEIELDKLAALLDPSLATMNDQDFLDAIEGLAVFFVHEPTMDPFYCPTGLGHEIDTVSLNIGVLQNALISDPSFRYEEAIR